MGRSAPVTYLSHVASFHSVERIAPSNRGIKHLAMEPAIAWDGVVAGHITTIYYGNPSTSYNFQVTLDVVLPGSPTTSPISSSTTEASTLFRRPAVGLHGQQVGPRLFDKGLIQHMQDWLLPGLLVTTCRHSEGEKILSS